jgi:hypothetical protein
MKQEHTPLTKEQYQAIKPGDVIERMLAFCIPMYLNVQKVEDGIIDAGWTFDRNTGLEIDGDIPQTVSYIRRVLTEEQKELLKTQKELSYP